MEEKKEINDHSDNKTSTDSPNYNYASSNSTIGQQDMCVQGGAFGESEVNQVDVEGNILHCNDS
jgi:hypothetical protein